MASVTFGTSERSNGEITGGWIADQIRDQERDGVAVCASILVLGDGINVRLTAGSCGGGGGGRHPAGRELEVLALYTKFHLDQGRLTPGELEAFVKQAMRL
jgi:hypothetical protein